MENSLLDSIKLHGDIDPTFEATESVSDSPRNVSHSRQLKRLYIDDYTYKKGATQIVSDAEVNQG
jgi:hypothetical protein